VGKRAKANQPALVIAFDLRSDSDFSESVLLTVGSLDARPAVVVRIDAVPSALDGPDREAVRRPGWPCLGREGAVAGELAARAARGSRSCGPTRIGRSALGSVCPARCSLSEWSTGGSFALRLQTRTGRMFDTEPRRRNCLRDSLTSLARRHPHAARIRMSGARGIQ
jgi:hypothetical protein